MIFISHSTQDKVQALNLHGFLVGSGYNEHQLFLDSHPESGIGAGQEWKKVLYDRIEECAAMIILWSEHWNASQWCFAELTHAEKERKPIFPVMLHEGILPDALKDHQAAYPYKDVRAYERLLSSLKEQYLGAEDLKSTKDQLPVDIRHYNRTLSQLIIPETETRTHLPIVLPLERSGNLSQNILDWAAEKKLPSVHDFDAIVVGIHTSEAKARLNDSKREMESALGWLDSRLLDLRRQKRSIEREIREIEHESMPLKPSGVKTHRSPDVHYEQSEWAAHARAEDYMQEIRQYEARMEVYKQTVREYKERQQSIPILRNRLGAQKQQTTELEVQYVNLNVKLKQNLAELEEAVNSARSRDILELFMKVRDEASHAMDDRQSMAAGFYALLTVKVLIPLLQPLLVDSWDIVGNIEEEIERLLEDATKTSHLVVGADFLSRWEEPQKAMRENEGELASINKILGSLSEEDLTETTTRVQRVTSIELPVAPDFSKVYDPAVFPKEDAALTKQQANAKQNFEECRTVIKEMTGPYKEAEAAIQKAEDCNSRMKATARHADEILNQVSQLTSIMDSTQKVRLHEHTRAFVVSMLGEVRNRLDKDQVLFIAQYKASRFWLQEAKHVLASHPTAKFLQAWTQLTIHIDNLGRYREKLEAARHNLELRPLQIYEEFQNRMGMLVVTSYIPVLQLYSAILMLSDRRLKPILQSQLTVLMPLRWEVTKSALKAITFASTIALVANSTLVYVWFRNPGVLRWGNYYIVVLAIIAACGYLSAILFLKAWIRFRHWSDDSAADMKSE